MATARRRPSPWTTLRGRPDIHLKFRPMAHLGVQGLCIPIADGNWIIALDVGLSQSERSAVLQHELEHVDAGGGCGAPWMPETWAAVVARDERRIDGQVARRLIPADQLAAFVADTHPDPVEEWQIAERFDVPLWVVRSLVA